jgi:hypothetical protein
MQVSRFLTWIVVALVATISTARAESTAFLLTGNAPQHQRELAARVAATAARTQLGSLHQPSFSAKDVSALTFCLRDVLPWTCMRKVVQGKNIHRLVFASVDRQAAKDGSPLIAIGIEIVDATLDSVIGDTRYCDHCTDDVLTATTKELVRDQLRELATRLGRTVVKIKSVPRGARITLDGKPYATTDLSINTYPGTHTITLELEGYQTEQRTIDAIEDKTVDVSVELRSNIAKAPLDGGGSHATRGGNPRHQDPSVRRSRMLPAALMITGGAAVIGGVVAYAIHDDRSTDPNVEQPPTYRDSAGLGVGLMIGGVVVGGVGGYLWWRYSKTSSAPVVTPTAGGAVLGLATRF